jgi:uncharacterized SAM-binding protein YcdF (DUF218 family)
MRKAVRRTLIVLVTAAAVVGVCGFLQGGRYLQHEDPLRRADAVFVLAGGRLERSLEAVDLYQAGYAPLIVLSPGRGEAVDPIARARGIRLPNETEQLRDALAGAGIPREAFLIGSGRVDNTAAEGSMIRSLAVDRGWRTLIVVTSKYHTRRAGYAMRRALDGAPVDVVMRASRYDPSDPARWWRHRRDIRWLAEEWPKLMAYRLGLAD